MLFVVLFPGTPKGSTGSGSGFKASQKTGQRLKVSSDNWEKPGIEPATPLVVCVHNGCSTLFSFALQQSRLILLNIKYKIVSPPKL